MIRYTQATLAKVAQIEAICSRDVGRGIDKLAQQTRGNLLAAARSIAEHPSPHIALITGFFIPHGTPPAAETDGPVGCAHLAAGLWRVGIPIRLVADSLCLNAVKQAAFAAGVPETVPLDVLSVDAVSNRSPAIASIQHRWATAGPPVSHAIAIECPGPGADGVVRNMRGHDVSTCTAPMETLLCDRQRTTIGIGDGGNELGMGKLSQDLIAQNIQLGNRIACTVPCDHLIVAGVSNWGAVGLLAALALLRPDWTAALLAGLTTAMDRQILTQVVEQGPAIDGVTGKQTLSVDNLSWEAHAAVLDQILDVIAK